MNPVKTALVIVLAVAAVACARLAEPRPPAMVLSQPVAVRDETLQEGNVSLKIAVWQRRYEVPGADAEEIGDNLKGLRAHGGYNAYTKWDMRWTLRYDDDASQCSLKAASVELYAVATLPLLVSPAALSAEEMERWQRYTEALEAHEEGHIENQIAGARAFQKALSELGAFSDCASLGEAVKAMGDKYKSAIREADAAFDAETEHGALMGATFP